MFGRGFTRQLLSAEARESKLKNAYEVIHTALEKKLKVEREQAALPLATQVSNSVAGKRVRVFDDATKRWFRGTVESVSLQACKIDVDFFEGKFNVRPERLKPLLKHEDVAGIRRNANEASPAAKSHTNSDSSSNSRKGSATTVPSAPENSVQKTARSNDGWTCSVNVLKYLIANGTIVPGPRVLTYSSEPNGASRTLGVTAKGHVFATQPGNNGSVVYHGAEHTTLLGCVLSSFEWEAPREGWPTGPIVWKATKVASTGKSLWDFAHAYLREKGDMHGTPRVKSRACTHSFRCSDGRCCLCSIPRVTKIQNCVLCAAASEGYMCAPHAIRFQNCIQSYADHLHVVDEPRWTQQQYEAIWATIEARSCAKAGASSNERTDAVISFLHSSRNHREHQRGSTAVKGADQVQSPNSNRAGGTVGASEDDMIQEL